MTHAPLAAPDPILLQLFGLPMLKEGASEQPIFNRAAQIIGMLALAPDQILRRAHVAEIVWGDPQSGQTNLRQVLSRLRRGNTLLTHLIEADASNLRLNTNGLDVDVLRVLSDQHDSEVSENGAIPLGDFLQGVDTPSAAFEDWLRDARHHLNDARRGLATSALEQATRFGRCDTAHFHALSAQLKSLDDGSGAVENTIAAATRRLGQVAPAQPTSQLEEPLPSSPPRLALLRPVTDDQDPLPLDQFVGDIADRLSRFRSFATLAPYSSFALRMDEIAQTANRLNIAYVVETRLSRQDLETALAVRLISTADSRIVWASEFLLNAETLPDCRRRLARTLALSLADQVEADLARQERMTGEPGAYLHFLSGRTQQLRGDLPALRRARNSFRAALRCDPGFAIASARIAETLVIEWILRGGTDGELLAHAHEVAQQARQTDPGAAEAYWVLGSTNLYRREYDRVAEHFETARTLAPHCADLLLNFADAMSHLGDAEQATSLFQQALDLNPTPPDRYWWFGASIALSSNDFSSAAHYCDQIKADEVAVGTRTSCYALAGQNEKAADWASRLRDVLPEMTVAELTGLMPGPSDSALHRNYREGLHLAGLK